MLGVSGSYPVAKSEALLQTYCGPLDVLMRSATWCMLFIALCFGGMHPAYAHARCATTATGLISCQVCCGIWYCRADECLIVHTRCRSVIDSSSGYS